MIRLECCSSLQLELSNVTLSLPSDATGISLNLSLAMSLTRSLIRNKPFSDLNLSSAEIIARTSSAFQPPKISRNQSTISMQLAENKEQLRSSANDVGSLAEAA